MAPVAEASRSEATQGQLLDERWLARGVLSGFLALGTMSVVIMLAYAFAATAPVASPRSSLLLRWFYALAHNPITRQTTTALPLALAVFVASGMVWALLYARWAEPYLPGSGWQRGVLFSLVPWVLSLVVFFPLVGGGFLGLSLGAGPFPVLGNLVLHLVYGAVLGHFCGEAGDRFEMRNADAASLWDQLVGFRQEQACVHWMVGGLAAGVVAGLLGNLLLPTGNLALAAIVGAVSGTLLGATIGLFAPPGPRNPPSPPDYASSR